MSTLFAFLHHLAAFVLVSALAVEFILMRQELTLASARRLQITDAVFGAAAGILLVVGLIRVFYFEKGAAYYWSSHAFLTKFGLFILVGLLFIIPTVEFLSWRRALKAGRLPEVSEKENQHPAYTCSRGIRWYRPHPAGGGHYGEGWVGLAAWPPGNCMADVYPNDPSAYTGPPTVYFNPRQPEGVKRGHRGLLTASFVVQG